MAQQQQEWLLQAETATNTWTTLELSNAPEFNLNQYTTRAVRRVGDSGNTIQHRINKLREGFEFTITLDYDPDDTVVSFLRGKLNDDAGVDFRLLNDGATNRYTNEFNALIVNESFALTAPDDAEGVDMINFTIRQNGDVTETSAAL